MPRSCWRARRGSASRRSGSRASSRALAGLRVFASRPAEAERGLAHVGLGDLFEDVLADVLPSLSTPRRRALEIALLREEAADDPVDHRALGVAVRDVLALAQRGRADSGRGRRRPVARCVLGRARLRSRCEGCCEPGSRAARPAARRRRRAVGVGAGARTSARAAAGWTAQRRCAPSAAARPARRSFARQTLLRIHERSGGNPFFALELARVLDVDVDPLEPLAGSGEAGRARPREARRAPGGDARRARARRGAGDAVGVAPGAGRRCRRRARAGLRRARDRARERHDSLHPPAAVVCSLPRPGRASGEAFTDELRGSSRTRSSARVISRSRATLPTPPPRACSRMPPARGRARRIGRRGRARRAGASADAAGASRRSPSSRAGGGSCASRRRGVDARPDDRERSAGGSDIGPLRAEASCSWPSSRSRPRPSGCSRRRCARRRSPPRAQPSSSAGSRGRALHEGFEGALEHARAALRAGRRARRRRAPGRRARRAAVSRPRRRRLPRRRHTPRGRTSSRPRSASAGCSEATARSRHVLSDAERTRRPCADGARVREWHERDECWQRPRALARLGRALERALAAAADVRRRATSSASSTGSRCRGPSADRGDRRPSRPARDRPRALGASAAAREEQIGLHTPVHLGALGLVALRSGDRARRWNGSPRPTADRALGWREPSNAVERRPRRGAARARPDRRRRAGPRRVGGGCAAARRALGARARDALPRARGCRRGDVSMRPLRSSRTRSQQHERSTTRSGGRVRCSRSAWSAGASGRSAPARERDRRGARRVRAARRGDLGREGPRRARPDRGANPDRGADACRATCRRARRRGPHEPRGCRRARSRAAHGGDAPDPRLRQARGALAGRARADVRADEQS